MHLQATAEQLRIAMITSDGTKEDTEFQKKVEQVQNITIEFQKKANPVFQMYLKISEKRLKRYTGQYNNVQQIFRISYNSTVWLYMYQKDL